MKINSGLKDTVKRFIKTGEYDIDDILPAIKLLYADMTSEAQQGFLEWCRKHDQELYELVADAEIDEDDEDDEYDEDGDEDEDEDESDDENDEDEDEDESEDDSSLTESVTGEVRS